MKARAPATVALVAAAFAAGLTGLSALRQGPGAALSPVETVAVAPGSFSYRLPGEYLRDGTPVDAPTRTVSFPGGFTIMKYQVGADEYARCVAAGACAAPEGPASGDVPVTGVSWRDAEAYASWLTRRTGVSWRLPTDEEWSFAAAERLHDDALGLPGDDANPAARWLALYRSEAAGKAGRDPQPKPRGHFGDNGKGVSDIAGNVWEWTSTCDRHASVTAGAEAGITASVGNCGVRVVDGRHRGYMSTFIRDGRSGGCAAGLAPDNLGIRLVREGVTPLAVAEALWTRLAG